ncbi:MAG: glycerophosphodiester phosphodiesterase [Deltaproteobacteria bacterium]|nr:glycerophosphodiester phosphodiesterase [Deltaproteobacteria bacterium]
MNFARGSGLIRGFKWEMPLLHNLPIKIIGHRGSPREEPENTLRSFRRALDLGAWGVELDVRLSRDGRLVVIHDPAVDRTTNGRGMVQDLTFAQLRELDAGRGEPIPALEEVVDLVRGRGGRLLVELKAPEAAGPLLRLFQKRRLFDDACLISFWHPVVKTLKEQEPRLQAGVLMVGCPVDPGAVARAAGADFLILNYAYVNRELADAVKAAGLKLIVWNIDEVDTLKFFLEFHPDAICTNRPGEIIDYLKSAGKFRLLPE